MAGKPKLDPNKTQKEEIADLKLECVAYYERNGVKTAAADWIGRTLVTVCQWEDADLEFHSQMLKAKAKFLESNRRRVKLDNLLVNMYPDEFKPPKQEIDATVTENHELDLLRQLINDAKPDQPLSTEQPTS